MFACRIVDFTAQRLQIFILIGLSPVNGKPSPKSKFHKNQQNRSPITIKERVCISQ